MNRRKAVAGSLLVQAGLGSIISWAMLFTSAHGRAGAILAPSFSSEWIIAAGLLAFAAAALASGLGGGSTGPRKLAAASGVILGAGFFLTPVLSIACLQQACLITAALGAAAGLVYLVSVDIGMKWYPEKKGIAAGVILAGSAFGGLCWFRVQEILVARLSLPDTLLIIGSCSALLVVAGSFLLSEPPAGYVPPVWRKPENPLADLPHCTEELSEIIRRPAFLITAGSMLLALSAAVFLSGNLQHVGSNILIARGLEVQLAARIALLAAAIFAISDGLGRIVWGMVADSIGSKLSFVILCAVETVTIVVIATMGGDGSVLIFGTFIAGTAMGGMLAVFPCIISEYLGEREFLKSCSVIFALCLVAAAAIILFSGLLRESFGRDTGLWLNVLLVSGLLPLAGGAVMLLLRKSRRLEPAGRHEGLQTEPGTAEQPPEGPAGELPEAPAQAPPEATMEGPIEGPEVGAPGGVTDGSPEARKEGCKEKDETIQQNNRET
jgi:MFS family permease